MTDTATQPIAFHSMPKIPRLNRACIVTEKIDGTNALVIVHEDGRVEAGSKKRLLVPGEQDNYGFRAWVDAHADELRLLGPGLHRGEWWGQGIGRKYGGREKTFSLFNVTHWKSANQTWIECSDWVQYLADKEIERTVAPTCCDVVPVLRLLPRMDALQVDGVVAMLRGVGSFAAPGFDRPEGVVVFHTASQELFKVTLEKDESFKGS